MFIAEGIIMGIHGENPPFMKTRKKIVIEEARLLWQKLLKECWQKTSENCEEIKNFFLFQKINEPFGYSLEIFSRCKNFLFLMSFSYLLNIIR